MRTHVFRDGSDGHVRDGVLVCETCRAWYPIEDDVLEFVPADLLYPEDAAAFQQRFADELASAGCPPDAVRSAPLPDRREPGHADQRKQRAHFDRYAESVAPGFEDYTRSVFIQAASARFHAMWKDRMEGPGSWVLDIGCGSATSSFPFADRHIVAGFDIAKKAVRRDTEEARARGLMARTTFFVADGAFLAFRDESFRFAQTFGALHHMPDPAQTVRDVVRILERGGIYFGVENNKTALRPIFDLMMKVKPLWIEEAGAEPLISEAMIRGWTAGLPVEVECRTSIFLPPHLLNLFRFDAARTLLDWSDRACLRVPWLKANGGQIVYAVRKTG